MSDHERIAAEMFEREWPEDNWANLAENDPFRTVYLRLASKQEPTPPVIPVGSEARCPRCNGFGGFVAMNGYGRAPCPDCQGTGHEQVTDDAMTESFDHRGAERVIPEPSYANVEGAAERPGHCHNERVIPATDPEVLDIETIRWNGALWSRAPDPDAPAPDPATWVCKIGEIPRDWLPRGSDAPMRQAVERAYEKLTGQPPDFTFSGWAGELTEGERAVHEDRLPRGAEWLVEDEAREALREGAAASGPKP